jgi:hypothetical protein
MYACMHIAGVWADGPTSQWKGDYHLNVNLQQALWAADSTAIYEAAEPLLDFLERLADMGHDTAVKLYNISTPATDRLNPATDRLNPATDRLNPATDRLNPSTDRLNSGGGDRHGSGIPPSRAWVSHGFTDNRLVGYMLDNPSYSLCVTCGE